ncbi:uncharacterized protein LOC111619421 [Centruroides sculpturatus]|uniref:uncharacterized protein LOC111619421 n=1 Tax=Centruroides sculpturatus TaxID=218467 RepID=UPI000C6DF589|nr:uncharacterized protein LOC111619421 [Centruroides sculpturatus]
MIRQKEHTPPQNGDPQTQWNLPTKNFELVRASFLNYHKKYKEIKTLITLQPSQKKRTGLIDAGGKILKFLFGTATSEDIKTLNDKISKVNHRNEGIIHLLRSQTTLLNDILNISKTNRHQIYVLFKRQESFRELMNLYRYELAFEIILRMIEFSIQEFHFQLVELREAIDILEQGRLSIYFISREIMLRTLRDIQLQLPEGYVMIEPIKPDTLFKYYQWITTIVVALPGKLRIFAKIPLITRSGYFDMYEIVKFPTYIPTLKTFFQFQTEYPIIALSMDRQSYMLLQRFELTMCKIDHFPICSLNIPIQRFPQESCEYALFNEIETQVKDLRNRQIVARYAPIFKKIDRQGTWIYFTPKPLTITIRCPTRPQKSPYISTTHKLNNTGIINLPNACTGYLPGIILTSHFQRQSTLQLEIAKTL